MNNLVREVFFVMVNAKKHRELLQKQLIDIYIPSPFESWLRRFYGENRKESFMNYWGGINGAIHKKFENWNPDEEEYFKHTDGFYYAKSNNEPMEGVMCYSFLGSQKKGKLLWDKTRRYIEDIGLDVLFLNIEDYLDNNFHIFSLFEEVKCKDIVFIRNMTQEMQMFLLNFGLQECIDYIYFFFNPEETKRLYDEAKKDDLLKDGSMLCIEYEPLSKKEGKIGFELYDNLKEWKKEITAPTRDDPEYLKMKKRVRKRDNYTCQCCGFNSHNRRNHGLEVHHIYGYTDHLDYRVEDSNCVSLCRDCHKKYHSLYDKENITPITFAKFIRDYNTYNK